MIPAVGEVWELFLENKLGHDTNIVLFVSRDDKYLRALDLRTGKTHPHFHYARSEMPAEWRLVT